MAGKLKMPTMESPLFSFTPVDRKTLANWRARIELADLEMALDSALLLLAKDMAIEYHDSRQLGNLVEVFHLIRGVQHTFGITARRSHGFAINGIWTDMIMNESVDNAAAASIPSGLEYLLIANTYRAMHQELTGPIPGFAFNITIAGIVALCMRLNVPVNFDS